MVSPRVSFLLQYVRPIDQQLSRNQKPRFKVVKTPLPDSLEFDLQPLLQPLLGYEFFKVDSQSGHFHELDLAFGPAAMADYWLRLDDLAQDVAKLLDQYSEKSRKPMRRIGLRSISQRQVST